MNSNHPCPVCQEWAPPSFLVCEACNREVPASLHIAWKSASHYAAAAAAYKKDRARIVATQAAEEQAAKKIISYLRQHGSALPA
jgi:hypothetical protein